MPGIADGLFAARTGIASHGTAISVLADNIANLNTTGFKQSRPDFADVLAGSLGGSSGARAGNGSSISVISQILTQGTFEVTGRGLDTGIDGQGVFVLRDPNSGRRLYSRAGNFSVDTDGNIINQNGLYVLGFPSTGAGGLGPLNINQTSQDNVQTNAVGVNGNLDAGAPIFGGTVPAIGDDTTFNSLATNAQFSTFVEVFDSLGSPHTVNLYYFKTGNNTWEWRAAVDVSETTATATPPNDALIIGGDTLTFGSDGARNPAPTGPDDTLTVTWDNGASASSVEISLDPFTQFFASSAINGITQDGTGVGNVVGFAIEEDGTIFAQLSNGQSASIGRIAMALFANPEGLSRIGGSLFAESGTSGEPVIGTPGTGNFGSLESGALEQSTADLAADFVKLISIQRGFQGSSRIITNIDDLLNEIINLA